MFARAICDFIALSVHWLTLTDTKNERDHWAIVSTKKKQKQTTKIVKHYYRFIAAIRKGKTSEKVSKRTLYRKKGAKQKLKSIRKTTPLLFVLFIFILNQILFVCTKSTCVGCVLNETLRKFRGIRFVSFFILSIQQQRFLFYSISRSLVVLTT